MEPLMSWLDTAALTEIANALGGCKEKNSPLLGVTRAVVETANNTKALNTVLFNVLTWLENRLRCMSSANFLVDASNVLEQLTAYFIASETLNAMFAAKEDCQLNNLVVERIQELIMQNIDILFSFVTQFGVDKAQYKTYFKQTYISGDPVILKSELHHCTNFMYEIRVVINETPYDNYIYSTYATKSFISLCSLTSHFINYIHQNNNALIRVFFSRLFRKVDRYAKEQIVIFDLFSTLTSEATLYVRNKKDIILRILETLLAETANMRAPNPAFMRGYLQQKGKKGKKQKGKQQSPVRQQKSANMIIKSEYIKDLNIQRDFTAYQVVKRTRFVMQTVVNLLIQLVLEYKEDTAHPNIEQAFEMIIQPYLNDIIPSLGYKSVDSLSTIFIILSVISHTYVYHFESLLIESLSQITLNPVELNNEKIWASSEWELLHLLECIQIFLASFDGIEEDEKKESKIRVIHMSFIRALEAFAFRFVVSQSNIISSNCAEILAVVASMMNKRFQSTNAFEGEKNSCLKYIISCLTHEKQQVILAGVKGLNLFFELANKNMRDMYVVNSFRDRYFYKYGLLSFKPNDVDSSTMSAKYNIRDYALDTLNREADKAKEKKNDYFLTIASLRKKAYKNIQMTYKSLEDGKSPSDNYISKLLYGITLKESNIPVLDLTEDNATEQNTYLNGLPIEEIYIQLIKLLHVQTYNPDKSAHVQNIAASKPDYQMYNMQRNNPDERFNMSLVCFEPFIKRLLTLPEVLINSSFLQVLDSIYLKNNIKQIPDDVLFFIMSRSCAALRYLNSGDFFGTNSQNNYMKFLKSDSGDEGMESLLKNNMFMNLFNYCNFPLLQNKMSKNKINSIRPNKNLNNILESCTEKTCKNGILALYASALFCEAEELPQLMGSNCDDVSLFGGSNLFSFDMLMQSTETKDRDKKNDDESPLIFTGSENPELLYIIVASIIYSVFSKGIFFSFPTHKYKNESVGKGMELPYNLTERPIMMTLDKTSVMNCIKKLNNSADKWCLDDNSIMELIKIKPSESPRPFSTNYCTGFKFTSDIVSTAYQLQRMYHKAETVKVVEKVDVEDFICNKDESQLYNCLKSFKVPKLQSEENKDDWAVVFSTYDPEYSDEIDVSQYDVKKYTKQESDKKEEEKDPNAKLGKKIMKILLQGVNENDKLLNGDEDGKDLSNDLAGMNSAEQDGFENFVQKCNIDKDISQFNQLLNMSLNKGVLTKENVPFSFNYKEFLFVQRLKTVLSPLIPDSDKLLRDGSLNPYLLLKNSDYVLMGEFDLYLNSSNKQQPEKEQRYRCNLRPESLFSTQHSTVNPFMAYCELYNLMALRAILDDGQFVMLNMRLHHPVKLLNYYTANIIANIECGLILVPVFKKNESEEISHYVLSDTTYISLNRAIKIMGHIQTLFHKQPKDKEISCICRVNNFFKCNNKMNKEKKTSPAYDNSLDDLLNFKDYMKNTFNKREERIEFMKTFINETQTSEELFDENISKDDKRFNYHLLLISILLHKMLRFPLLPQTRSHSCNKRHVFSTTYTTIPICSICPTSKNGILGLISTKLADKKNCVLTSDDIGELLTNKNVQEVSDVEYLEFFYLNLETLIYNLIKTTKPKLYDNTTFLLTMRETIRLLRDLLNPSIRKINNYNVQQCKYLNELVCAMINKVNLIISYYNKFLDIKANFARKKATSGRGFIIPKDVLYYQIMEEGNKLHVEYILHYSMRQDNNGNIALPYDVKPNLFCNWKFNKFMGSKILSPEASAQRDFNFSNIPLSWENLVILTNILIPSKRNRVLLNGMLNINDYNYDYIEKINMFDPDFSLLFLLILLQYKEYKSLAYKRIIVLMANMNDSGFSYNYVASKGYELNKPSRLNSRHKFTVYNESQEFGKLNGDKSRLLTHMKRYSTFESFDSTRRPIHQSRYFHSNFMSTTVGYSKVMMHYRPLPLCYTQCLRNVLNILFYCKTKYFSNGEFNETISIISPSVYSYGTNMSVQSRMVEDVNRRRLSTNDIFHEKSQKLWMISNIRHANNNAVLILKLVIYVYELLRIFIDKQENNPQCEIEPTLETTQMEMDSTEERFKRFFRLKMDNNIIREEKAEGQSLLRAESLLTLWFILIDYCIVIGTNWMNERSKTYACDIPSLSVLSVINAMLMDILPRVSNGEKDFILKECIPQLSVKCQNMLLEAGVNHYNTLISPSKYLLSNQHLLELGLQNRLHVYRLLKRECGFVFKMKVEQYNKCRIAHYHRLHLLLNIALSIGLCDYDFRMRCMEDKADVIKLNGICKNKINTETYSFDKLVTYLLIELCDPIYDKSNQIQLFSENSIPLVSLPLHKIFLRIISLLAAISDFETSCIIGETRLRYYYPGVNNNGNHNDCVPQKFMINTELQKHVVENINMYIQRALDLRNAVKLLASLLHNKVHEMPACMGQNILFQCEFDVSLKVLNSLTLACEWGLLWRVINVCIYHVTIQDSDNTRREPVCLNFLKPLPQNVFNQTERDYYETSVSLNALTRISSLVNGGIFNCGCIELPSLVFVISLYLLRYNDNLKDEETHCIMKGINKSMHACIQYCTEGVTNSLTKLIDHYNKCAQDNAIPMNYDALVCSSFILSMLIMQYLPSLYRKYDEVPNSVPVFAGLSLLNAMEMYRCNKKQRAYFESLLFNILRTSKDDIMKNERALQSVYCIVLITLGLYSDGSLMPSLKETTCLKLIISNVCRFLRSCSLRECELYKALVGLKAEGQQSPSIESLVHQLARLMSKKADNLFTQCVLIVQSLKNEKLFFFALMLIKLTVAL